MPTKNSVQILLLFFLSLNSTLLLAQSFGRAESILQGRLILPQKQLQNQQSHQILLQMDIEENWHINSNKPLEDFLIPTEITMTASEGISFGRVRYMEPEIKAFSFSDTEMSVYEGTVYALISITISPDFKGPVLTLKGSVYFQACNDESCLAPVETFFETVVPIVDNTTPADEINKNIYGLVLPGFEESEAVPTESEFAKVIRESGLVYSLFFIFLGGLALNLTPCVYPLIPITISYFGGQSEGRKGGLVLRAILYVLGMAITYSFLGVLAALTGGLLGSALQNPLVLIFVALVMIGLALSMFGVYEIRVPQSLAMLGGKNRAGYFGTLFMGLTVGIIAAPCIGPFVLGLLTYVSELGDPVIGFWMFFILALGLGTPFLILGIFSGAAAHLPRSGAWMIWVRKIFGFVLLGMAIYFLEPLFPGDTIYFYTLAVLAVIAGIYLAWIDKTKGKKGFQVARSVIGITFILIGVYLVLPSEANSGSQIKWQPYTPKALQEATREGKAVIIDFYADWCIPCKELDKFTFSDQQVIEESGNFISLKADLTHFDSEITTALKNTYKIAGVPTIVFLSERGEEITELRLVGYENAEKFLSRMQQVWNSDQ